MHNTNWDIPVIGLLIMKQGADTVQMQIRVRNTRVSANDDSKVRTKAMIAISERITILESGKFPERRKLVSVWLAPGRIR